VADSEIEHAHLSDALLKPIPSVWGHRAGNPSAAVQEQDRLFIDNELKALLAR
jgi:homoserine O-acetyltransferase